MEKGMVINMGTQFFWFYDVLIVAILIGVVFKCTKKGFASGFVGLVGIILAFTISLAVSAPASAYIYDNLIKPGVINKIDYNSSDSTGTASSTKGSAEAAFKTLRNTDMSTVVIAGKPISMFKNEITPDSSGTVTVELKDVDLRMSGINDGDMGFFGVDSCFAFPVSPGKVNISATEYAKYSFEDIVLAKTVSYQISEKAKSNNESLNKTLTDTIPGFSKASQGGTDLISMLLLSIMNTDSDNLESAINEHLVRPVLIVPFRALVFAIIFAAISVVVSIVANSMQAVNSIPIFGRVNSFLGSILGVVQATVIIFMVCIGVRIIISLTADNIIFLNTMTINETLLFRHIYDIKFLNFN